MKKSPFVGVGINITKNGKFLLGKRKNAHGYGYWCPPGGHVNFGEHPKDAALREVKEETGMTLSDIHFADITSDLFEDNGRHYVTIQYSAICPQELEPKVMEPDKCELWEWFDINELPSPLFMSTENLFKQGYDPFA